MDTANTAEIIQYPAEKIRTRVLELIQEMRDEKVDLEGAKIIVLPRKSEKPATKRTHAHGSY